MFLATLKIRIYCLGYKFLNVDFLNENLKMPISLFKLLYFQLAFLTAKIFLQKSPLEVEISDKNGGQPGSPVVENFS